MSANWLAGLAERRRAGSEEAVTSVCSAHPFVIEAVLTRDQQVPVLIEATCNQVNQEGGYTGLTPADFRKFVGKIADGAGYNRELLVLGGDHLGPTPWRHLGAEAAMFRAERMVAAYVEAGFSKLHLDTSVGCRGEPDVLGDEVVAERAARLAAVAEESARRLGVPLPLYVVGTEVPAPGGAAHALDTVAVTRPEAVLETLAVHRDAFVARGLQEACARIIAVVVQPGVEFDHSRVVIYEPAKAAALSKMLTTAPEIVFESHSTDYQPSEMLHALARDGFAILKVGPALTFALREALYALDHMMAASDTGWRTQSLESAMERLMLAEPGHWQCYYTGSEQERRILRHYSYSDRIRYYWPKEEARAGVDRLMQALAIMPISPTLISQFLPYCYPLVRDGRLACDSRSLILASIRHVLSAYPCMG